MPKKAVFCSTNVAQIACFVLQNAVFVLQKCHFVLHLCYKKFTKCSQFRAKKGKNRQKMAILGV